MNRQLLFSACAAAAVLSAAAYAATPAAPPPPIANYWVDVATSSGMGAGMTPGARPDMGQMMRMLQGGSSVSHTLELRLASRQGAAANPSAQHFIPPGLQMGPSLPLATPAAATPVREMPGMPSGYEQPKGRMLIYWGCGEHVGPGQPTVIDFSKLAAGQVPPGMAAMAGMGRAAVPPRPGQSAGYGEWPNDRDSRLVPVQGSLVGAHRVEGNYSPPIAFSLAAGQDFMPDLGFNEGAPLPSGAVPLTWRPAPQATGYALAMFGGAENGDVIVWTSASKAATAANLDYLPPAEVKQLISAGAALPPTSNQCRLPAEVAAASPGGMIMMIGYGPEAFFSDDPKAPKWTTRLRYKTTASLLRGMGAMGNMQGSDGQPAQVPRKKKKKFGIGDIIGNVPNP
ncbi:MAG TPA: hypothetical protein VFR36_08930 [Sphingomicrobium sp.]|nr:hypothetical protein [Sphingomicrobium sp.]